jgi:ferrochelatase
MILQALALKMALEAKGLASNVYVGMRYWFPFTEEAVQQVSPYTLDHI